MDALLILLYYFDELCTKITFCTSNHKMPLWLIKEKLGHENCKALLRFHVVTRSDLTGRFYGYSKQACWDVFVSLSTHVIQAPQSRGNIARRDMELLRNICYEHMM